MDIDMSALRLLEREREIPLDLLIPTIEQALLVAYHKSPGAFEKARAELDRKSGHVTIWAVEIDDDGAPIGEFEDTPAGFGRIAASTARQIILQRLRDVEDDNVLGEFKGREGELVCRHHPAGQQPAHDPGQPGHRGSAAAAARAGSRGEVHPRQPAPRLGHRRPPRHQGSVRHAVPFPPRPGPEALRTGSAGDRGPLRGDRGTGPRSRPPHQDRCQSKHPRASTPRVPASAKWVPASGPS